MLLRLYAYRFEFEALDAIFLPEGKTANVFRGALGLLFRQVACLPGCDDAKTCAQRMSCAYARFFEPIWETGPSGLADPPRPFVLRPGDPATERLAPGSRLQLDVHVFDLREPALAYLVLALSRLAAEGLGPGRGRARLRQVLLLDAMRQPAGLLFDGDRVRDAAELLTVDIPMAPPPCGQRLRVRFRTPTELKSGSELVREPRFDVLVARIRDRVAALRRLYGEGPLDIDFAGLAARAAQVHLTRSELQWQHTERRSSRTGQRHPIGGFTGVAEYEGEVAEFLPYLAAGAWTGVGRQTVWGKGAMEVVAM